MPRHDPKLFESDQPPTGLRVPHVSASRHARSALDVLRRSQGRQVIVLGATSARLSVAHVRRAAGYVAYSGEVRIGTVAHCPVYAALGCIETCPHDALVLDLHGVDARGVPVFVTRPESRVERQERILNRHAVGR